MILPLPARPAVLGALAAFGSAAFASAMFGSAILTAQPTRPQQPATASSMSAALDAGAYPAFSDLRSACIAMAPGSCVVRVSQPTPLTVTGAATVPANMQVQFGPGGLWQIQGGTLDFAGGSVDAPADRQVFAGGGRVAGLRQARPEWFVPPAADPLPSSGLAAAYRATMRYGTILLNARSYLSPFTALPQSISAHGDSSQVVYDTPRTLLGAGRPLPDSDTDPTHLVGGTILLGQVVGTGPIAAAHLGVDDGPAVAARYFGGFIGHGLAMFGTGRLEGTGTRIEDVSVLTGKGESTHSVMIEAQSDATVRGLWLWSLGAVHGLVIKSSHSTVDDYHCKGADGDCLIIKSDYTTSRAGYAAHDVLTNLYFSDRKVPGDTGGVVIESTWDTVRDVTLRNVHMEGLTFGFSVLGSVFFHPSDLQFDNVTAQNMAGPCVYTEHVRSLQISHFDCGLLPGKIGFGFLLRGGSFRLADIDIHCAGSAAACREHPQQGIQVASGDARLERIHGSGLRGALIATRHPLSASEAAQLGASDTASPLVVAYIAPHQTSGERLRKLKPPLRIMYTWTQTRLREKNAGIWLLVLVGAGFFVWVAIAAGRARRRTLAR